MSFKERFDLIKEQYNSREWQGERDKLVKRLNGKQIVLFGAAWIGDFAWEKLEKMGFAPLCFCDNFAEGTSPAGHSPIIRPAELKEKYPDAIIILTLDKARETVYTQLMQMGFRDEQIIKRAPFLTATLTMDTFSEHIDGYEWAYNFFDDAQSKDIIMQRIQCYLLGKDIVKSPYPQYFEKEIVQLDENEIFADGGFFTGDTAEEFIRQVGNKYHRIYGFEPDTFVAEKAADFLRENPKVTLIPKGLYKCDTTLKFASTGGKSQASGGNIVDDNAKGAVEIPVTSIDSFFSDGKEPPTFIKMDIEGSEQDALRGAEHVIRTYRPKLAICIYHKPEDMYRIPEIVSSFRDDYRYHLRHYANYFWETVMYAT